MKAVEDVVVVVVVVVDVLVVVVTVVDFVGSCLVKTALAAFASRAIKSPQALKRAERFMLSLHTSTLARSIYFAICFARCARLICFNLVFESKNNTSERSER